jgi:hypothetical protein
MLASTSAPVRKTTWAPSNVLLRTVMFFVRASSIWASAILRPSIVMLLAGSKLSFMTGIAPGCAPIVTIPDFRAPRNTP